MSLSLIKYPSSSSGPSASASTADQSKYLLSESGGVFSINGPKILSNNNKNLISLYKMPIGNLTNNIDTITKFGSMTTATIALNTGFDRVIVAGSTEASYFRLPMILTANKVIHKLRVRVDALGVTAPIIGFRNTWPGSTYSNFNNLQYFGYFNLSTGVGTVQLGSGVTSTPVSSSYNGFATAVGVADIVELELVFDYMANATSIKISKVSDTLTGDASIVNQLKSSTNDGNYALITHPGVILADGTYTILDYEIFSQDFEPYFMIDGDSMGTSVRIPYSDSLRGKLESKLPYRVSCIAATTKKTKGDLATSWQITTLRPKYIVLFRYLDALQGLANPLNAGYAVWHADFTKYISTIKALGCTPIFVHPETWTSIANATNCQYYTDYLNTNYPSDIKIYVTTAESFYDSTPIHYTGVTNEIIANKIITALSGVL